MQNMRKNRSLLIRFDLTYTPLSGKNKVTYGQS